MFGKTFEVEFKCNVCGNNAKQGVFCAPWELEREKRWLNSYGVCDDCKMLQDKAVRDFVDASSMLQSRINNDDIDSLSSKLKEAFDECVRLNVVRRI